VVFARISSLAFHSKLEDSMSKSLLIVVIGSAVTIVLAATAQIQRKDRPLAHDEDYQVDRASTANGSHDESRAADHDL
jgi:hypothetical protein